MLENLSLKNIGPADELDFEFGSRLNFVTGDNGLGKTFLLDVAWWALTRTWADNRVLHPTSDVEEAQIAYHVHGKSGPNQKVTLAYRKADLDWSLPPRRPPSPGLILYARIDGGFSLWDPERNYWNEKATETHARIDRPASFQFSKKQLWEGLEDDAGKKICRGLLEDWETWSLKANGMFSLLKAVLETLSPGANDIPLKPGKSVRVPGMGVQDVPTLAMPYGDVPLHQSSAGIRRILSLAYMLVWAWSEHKEAAKLRGHESTNRIVLLWDEVEAHLHPQWQRTIMPATVKALEYLLNGKDETQVQVIATTHAPFVLASLETIFDETQDRLFSLELTHEGRVERTNITWSKQGDIVSWLKSPAFDMQSGYSREAEGVLKAAQAWLANRKESLPENLNTVESITKGLKSSLADDDPFWPRWNVLTGRISKDGEVK